MSTGKSMAMESSEDLFICVILLFRQVFWKRIDLKNLLWWILFSVQLCCEMQLYVKVKSDARNKKTHMNIKYPLVFSSVCWDIKKYIQFSCLFVFVTSGQTKMMTVKHNTIYTTTLSIDKWWDSLRGEYITSKTLQPNLILRVELQRQWFQRLIKILWWTESVMAVGFRRFDSVVWKT